MRVGLERWYDFGPIVGAPGEPNLGVRDPVVPLHSFARLAAFALILAPVARVRGQSSEVWPEVDMYWRPAEHQRTMLELASSSDRDGPKHEATIGLYQDYLRLPLGYIRGGYRFTFSTNDASYRESRIVTELVLGRTVPFTMRLVNRLRPEFRWINGDYSWRLRDRLHLQHLPKKPQEGRAWAPYGTFEAYYDSRYSTIARIGYRTGTEARLGARAGIDVYVARQENSRPTTSSVNALGTTLKLYY